MKKLKILQIGLAAGLMFLGSLGSVSADERVIACNDDFCTEITEQAMSVADTTCGKDVCLVCDMNGNCHLEKKQKFEKKSGNSFFELRSLETKVAPRDPLYQCKLTPKNQVVQVAKIRPLSQKKPITKQTG